MDGTDLKSLAGKRAKQLIQNGSCKDLPFHNLCHTEEVVENVKTISDYLEITDYDKELLIIAAWFHDVGYCETYHGHEVVSCNFLRSFLEENTVSENKIQFISSIIMATEFHYKPATLLEGIIKDADTFHLSKPNYLFYLNKLRKEWEDLLDITHNNVDFINLNILFLRNHSYFTAYGKHILSIGKMKNINKLKREKGNMQQ